MINGDGEEMDGVALPGWGLFGGGLRSPMKSQQEWQDETDAACAEASDAVRRYLAAHAERLAAEEELAREHAAQMWAPTSFGSSPFHSPGFLSPRIIELERRCSESRSREEVEKAKVEGARSGLERLREAVQAEGLRSGSVVVPAGPAPYAEHFGDAQEVWQLEQDFFERLGEQIAEALHTLVKVMASANLIRRSRGGAVPDLPEDLPGVGRTEPGEEDEEEPCPVPPPAADAEDGRRAAAVRPSGGSSPWSLADLPSPPVRSSADDSRFGGGNTPAGSFGSSRLAGPVILRSWIREREQRTGGEIGAPPAKSAETETENESELEEM